MSSWLKRKPKTFTCVKCGKIFNKIAARAKLCSKECYKSYQLSYYNNRRKNSIKGTLAAIVAGARSRAKKKCLECDIDLNYILALYDKQNGLCARTGVKLEISAVNSRQNTNPNTVSIDRINSNKGYTKDNIELVTTIYNTAKNNWTSNDVLEMAKQLCARS